MDLFLIHPNVHLGANGQIGEYAIIGVPPRGSNSGDLETNIGPNAIIRSHTVIYADNHIGASFQTGHSVMIRESNEIGDDVSIGTHSIIEHHVRLGNRVRIHSNVFIPEYSIIESDAWIGPNVVVTNARYPQSPETKSNLKGAHVMPRAKIGANSTLLPGITIGRGALIGAGSVVVHDVPDGKVVVGNPARIIKDVMELTAYSIAQLTDNVR